MKVRDFSVKLVESEQIKEFVKKWHYSRTIKGVNISYCFGLYDKGILIGAIIYGTIGMPNVWKGYSDNKEDIIELRRLCCIDDTPKNTESYFISKTIKWLKNNTKIKKIISYSDLTYGHTGIVYRASNFKLVKTTSGGKVIEIVETGETYHDRVLRSKKNGTLKPIALRLMYLLDRGKARYKKTKGKNVYIYEVRK